MVTKVNGLMRKKTLFKLLENKERFLKRTREEFTLKFKGKVKITDAQTYRIVCDFAMVAMETGMRDREIEIKNYSYPDGLSLIVARCCGRVWMDEKEI